MFTFVMDIKDGQSVNEQELARVGITEDFAFGERIYEEFKTANPDWSTEGSSSSYELENMVNDMFFTAKDFTPKTIDEAISFVTNVFFFPPVYIWMDGKKIDVSDVSTEQVIRFRG